MGPTIGTDVSRGESWGPTIGTDISRGESWGPTIETDASRGVMWASHLLENRVIEGQPHGGLQGYRSWV